MGVFKTKDSGGQGNKIKKNQNVSTNGKIGVSPLGTHGVGSGVGLELSEPERGDQKTAWGGVRWGGATKKLGRRGLRIG